MTIEETKKAIEVMQAFVDGKNIEQKNGDGTAYVLIGTPLWNWGNDVDCYRIKLGPHYRPFKNAEEVMEAIKEHGDWLDSTAGYKVNISEFNNAYVWMGSAKQGITFEDAFNNYHFERDGTPFGKLEE